MSTAQVYTEVYEILKVLSPTLNFEVGHIASLPVIYDKEKGMF